MNQIRKDILTSIDGYSQSRDGELECVCSFPVSFTGFKGHFPGQSVLPGICMVQLVLMAFGQHRNQSFRLKEIAVAKYFSVVVPNERLRVVMTVKDADAGALKLRGRIQKGEGKVADLTLLITKE